MSTQINIADLVDQYREPCDIEDMEYDPGWPTLFRASVADVSWLTELLDYFESNIVRADSGCWEWQGYRDRGGYGRMGGRTYRRANISALAHRALYEVIVGQVPDGLHLDHLCRNRACVNPAHLEPVTPAENSRRGFGIGMVNAAKTHCNWGHPLSGDNVRITSGKRGSGRTCRECERRRRREAQTRKRLIAHANPEYLEAVARIERLRRQTAARGLPTHCKRGHSYAEYAKFEKTSGVRYCGECHRMADANAYARRKRRATA